MKYALYASLVILACSCSLWQSYPVDNVAEEIVEELIEYKYGIPIDLSPFSEEN